MRVLPSLLAVVLLGVLPARAQLILPRRAAKKRVVQGAPIHVDLHDLESRWKGDDVEAGRLLLACARGAGPDETSCVRSLAGGGTKGIAALHDELKALAAEKGVGPRIETRYAAGDLMQAVQHWDNFDSPQAEKTRAEYRFRERLKELGSLAVVSLMPLTAVVGALWVVWSRTFLVWLLIGRSTALSRAFGDAGRVVEREHRAALLLPAAAAVTSFVTGVTVWKAMSLVTSGTTAADAGVLAWRAVLSARVLAAYFSAGFAFYFMHAMFLSMMIDVARGLRPDFVVAFGRARARWREILTLSSAVFGGLLLVELGLNKARQVAPRAATLLAVAAWLVETGVTVASVLLLAVALGDGVGLLEAGRRAGAVLTGKARPALLSILGIEALEGDIVGTPVIAAMMLGMSSLPVTFILFPDGFAQRLGFPLGFTEAHVMILGGVVLAVLLSGVMYSGVLAMESIAAAGLYSYGRDDQARGPIVELLRREAPEAAGVLARFER